MMKTLKTLFVSGCLLAIALNIYAVTPAEPKYERMRAIVKEGSWPTNGVLSVTGQREKVLMPKQLCVDVGLANKTNTCTVTLVGASSGSTYTFDTLTAQVNGSESPIELTNKTYSIAYGETMKFTSSITGTDATNMTYRLLLFEAPQGR